MNDNETGYDYPNFPKTSTTRRSAANNIAVIKRLVFRGNILRILEAAYPDEITVGTFAAIAQAGGCDATYSARELAYLASKGYIKTRKNRVMITSYGIDLVEGSSVAPGIIFSGVDL